MISFPTILLRLAVALVLGLLVGLEREQKEHSAGMRTIALVTLGSALFTIVSAYGFLSLLGLPHISLDPTRIASYIVAGIGFLGAGTIFMSREGEKVKGLTTAATIWLMAAVGMACGAGLLLEAASVTIIALLVLIVLQYVERLILPRSSSSQHHIHIEAKLVSGPFIAKVYETCAQHGVKIEKLRIDTAQEGDHIELDCRISNASSLPEAISELYSFPGVSAIHTDAQYLSTDREASSSKK